MRSLVIVVACIWIAGVAYAAGLSWPAFPLDMPAGDPQVRAAYDSALRDHVVRYGLIALVPAAALVGIGWMLSRRNRAAS